MKIMHIECLPLTIFLSKKNSSAQNGGFRRASWLVPISRDKEFWAVNARRANTTWRISKSMRARQKAVT